MLRVIRGVYEPTIGAVGQHIIARLYTEVQLSSLKIMESTILSVCDDDRWLLLSLLQMRGDKIRGAAQNLVAWNLQKEA